MCRYLYVLPRYQHTNVCHLAWLFQIIKLCTLMIAQRYACLRVISRPFSLSLFILDVLVSISCRACSDIDVLKTQAIEHPRDHNSELSQALRDRVLIIKLEKEAPGGGGTLRVLD